MRCHTPQEHEAAPRQTWRVPHTPLPPTFLDCAPAPQPGLPCSPAPHCILGPAACFHHNYLSDPSTPIILLFSTSFQKPGSEFPQIHTVRRRRSTGSGLQSPFSKFCNPLQPASPPASIRHRGIVAKLPVNHMRLWCRKGTRINKFAIHSDASVAIHQEAFQGYCESGVCCGGVIEVATWVEVVHVYDSCVVRRIW